jgi:hypothetical protein
VEEAGEEEEVVVEAGEEEEVVVEAGAAFFPEDEEDKGRARTVRDHRRLHRENQISSFLAAECQMVHVAAAA